MEQHKYRNLQELGSSDFQIVEGEPNITGWEVKNEAGTYVGEVTELLFDPESGAVRYLLVDLQDNGMNLGDKRVMIPLGIAHLHTSDDEVILPGLHIDQYNALPAYEKNELGPELELQIREIIGSPAALRLEEAMTEFDQNEFYNHHHFDRGRFYHRGGMKDAPLAGQSEIPEDQLVPAPGHLVHQDDENTVPVPEYMKHFPEDGKIPAPGSMSERADEQDTIHHLINHSKNPKD